jgi:hypothetical protein
VALKGLGELLLAGENQKYHTEYEIHIDFSPFQIEE